MAFICEVILSAKSAKHFTLFLANFHYVFGHKIGKNQKFKIPTPHALTRTQAASFKPNMATICEVISSAQSAEYFTPILANFIKSPKSTSFFGEAPKNLYHLKALLVGYKYLMISLHRLCTLHPEKNNFSVARSEK